MVKLRKDNLVLVYGKYTLLDKANPQVYAYTRELNDEKVLVMLNFSNTPAQAALPQQTTAGDEWINNYPQKTTIENNTAKLQPWQAVVIKLK